MGLFSILKKSNQVYYPGCSVCSGDNTLESTDLYKKILNKLGIDFRFFDNLSCCGIIALELGYESEARKFARENLENFRKNEIKRIITNCPACHKMFAVNYKEILPDFDLEVVNIWKLILDKLREKPRLIENIFNERASYNDSCYLSNYLDITQEPREILKLIGFGLDEMQNSRQDNFCCGSCGGLYIVNPELAKDIAAERILQAKRIGIKKIIVCSFKDYELLKEVAQGSDIEVLEISSVLAIALGLKDKPLPTAIVIDDNKGNEEENEIDETKLDDKNNIESDNMQEDEDKLQEGLQEKEDKDE